MKTTYVISTIFPGFSIMHEYIYLFMKNILFPRRACPYQALVIKQ